MKSYERPPLPIYPIVLAVASSVESSIFAIRVGEPLKNLQKSGFLSFTSKAIYEVKDNDLIEPNVLLLQRDFDARARRLLKLAERWDKAIIFEIDDLLTTPPPFLSIYQDHWRRRRDIEDAIDGADIVSVSTQRLKAALGGDNSKFRIAANYSEWPPERVALHVDCSNEAPITFVFASSDKVLVEVLIGPLKLVLEQLGEKGRLLVVGALAEEIQRQIKCEAFPSLSLGAFRDLMSGLVNPVGMIPLDRSAFSACKSAVKYFDFALCGIPVVASNVPPYNDVIVTDATGILCDDDPQQWHSALIRLAKSAEIRREMASQAAIAVRRDHGLEQNLKQWQDIIMSALTLAKLRTGDRKASKFTLELRRWRGVLNSLFVELRILNRRRKTRQS